MKFVSNAAPERTHEAILHVLDRTLPGDDDGSRPPIYYPAQSFESTVNTWSGTPIIFSTSGEHPDLDIFTNDQATALRDTNSRIVGTVGDTWIDKHGRAKLMGMLNIRDPEVEKLFNEGRLSLSTGFYATAINNEIMGGIRPNHILLFEEARYGTSPRDMGSQILNKVRPCQLKHGENMPGQVAVAPEAATGIAPGVLDRLKTLLVEATQILSGKAPVEPEVPVTATLPPVTTIVNAKQEIDPMDAELKAQAETLTKELADIKATNAKLEADRDLLQKRVAEIDAAAKEQKWNNVKAHLEVGRIDTPEKIAAERASMEADPVSFMLSVVNTKTVTTKPKEGIAAAETTDASTEAYMNAKKVADSRSYRPKSGRSK